MTQPVEYSSAVDLVLDMTPVEVAFVLGYLAAGDRGLIAEAIEKARELDRETRRG